MSFAATMSEGARQELPAAEPIVAGVDGCRGGWLVVMRPLNDPGAARAALLATFAQVLAIEPQPIVIAVDMPIGLPEKGGPGGRDCDIAARSVLSGRQSAVFAVPSRAAVMCADYVAACRVGLMTSQPPRKVSRQTFNLFPKMREIDVLMTPELQGRVFEVHPEVAFWALNAGVALSEPKKVKSKPYPPGLKLRRRLLAAAGYDHAILETKTFASSFVGPDDLLDAAANSWSAVRIAKGAERRFPADPPRDARGLRMEIVC